MDGEGTEVERLENSLDARLSNFVKFNGRMPLEMLGLLVIEDLFGEYTDGTPRAEGKIGVVLNRLIGIGAVLGGRRGPAKRLLSNSGLAKRSGIGTGAARRLEFDALVWLDCAKEANGNCRTVLEALLLTGRSEAIGEFVLLPNMRICGTDGRLCWRGFCEKSDSVFITGVEDLVLLNPSNGSAIIKSSGFVKRTKLDVDELDSGIEGTFDLKSDLGGVRFAGNKIENRSLFIIFALFGETVWGPDTSNEFNCERVAGFDGVGWVGGVTTHFNMSKVIEDNDEDGEERIGAELLVSIGLLTW
jgi:hypothetical protein